jgi:hypothetical protein
MDPMHAFTGTAEAGFLLIEVCDPRHFYTSQVHASATQRF